ncbi:MAG: hypothetical protein ACAI25_08095, partial [Planctomycetota bacterium]
MLPDELELFAQPPAPTPSTESVKVARVALDIPLRRLFDYSVPDALDAKVQVGARVVVNFHGRKTTGFVTERPATSEVPAAKLKPIAELVDAN